MSESFERVIATADWRAMTPRLLDYADRRIRRCFWRGIPVSATAGARLSVNGWDADDFVQEALDRLLKGTRTFREEVGLEQMLMGIIRSLIWSANKSSGRQPLLEPRQESDDDDHVARDAVDPAPTVADNLVLRETVATQEKLLVDFEASIDDPELLQLLHALKKEFVTPRAIAAHTGISASRISELKRKLRRRMDVFITTRSKDEFSKNETPK